jgi:peptidase E
MQTNLSNLIDNSDDQSVVRDLLEIEVIAVGGGEAVVVNY